MGSEIKLGLDATCILLSMIVRNESMVSELAYQLVKVRAIGRYLPPDVEPHHNSYFAHFWPLLHNWFVMMASQSQANPPCAT